MDERMRLLRAELALAEQEADFVAAKAAGAVTVEQKAALRDARREFRQMREAAPAEDGVARPVPAAGRVGVNGKRG